MGEVLAQLRFAFNRSIRVEARSEHLTADPGALVVREIEERLGLCRWLGKRISDPRDPDSITHPMTELLHTAIVLPACGYQDQDDADSLRDDPVMRLAVSDRRGTSPLEERTAEERAVSRNPDEPDGLASQPTLSRLERTLSEEENLKLLHRSLSWMTSRRVRRLRRGQRMRYGTLDVDSLPIDVVGQQPGSAYNEHFHGRVYHPLVASLAETADLLAVRLREGHVHTANGALDFVLPLLDYVETEICHVATVRIDAGFPDQPFLGGLEQRGTPYAARVKNNAVLDRMAEPYVHRPVGRPPSEPRTWCYEETYQAKSWSRPRRVVLVVLERPGELLLDWFWLVTNWSAEQQSATALLDFYRQRGTAEGHYGELKDVLDPLLSSSPRPKSHYRQQVLARTYPSGNSFLLNEVRLLLNAIAYNLMNLARNLIEAATGRGWSLRRLRERVLRGGARLVLHGRRAVLVISRSGARFWGPLASQLGSIGPPPVLRAL